LLLLLLPFPFEKGRSYLVSAVAAIAYTVMHARQKQDGSIVSSTTLENFDANKRIAARRCCRFVRVEKFDDSLFLLLALFDVVVVVVDAIAIVIVHHPSCCGLSIWAHYTAHIGIAFPSKLSE